MFQKILRKVKRLKKNKQTFASFILDDQIMWDTYHMSNANLIGQFLVCTAYMNKLLPVTQTLKNFNYEKWTLLQNLTSENHFIQYS